MSEGTLADGRLVERLSAYVDPAAYPLDEAQLDFDRMRAEIDERGYTIVPELIPPEDVERMRSYWRQRFEEPTRRPRVNWAPYFGEANCVGFNDDSFQCLYRSCDFLWNRADHEITRGVGLYLHAIRNRIVDEDPLKGLLYSEDRYGIFITTSYYPAGRGWLQKHSDGVRGQPGLVHHVLPLTFKGEHYEGGGLFLVDKAGRRVDVDAAMGAGSAVFFDASCEHGVDRVQSRSQIGRMQLFAIPTAFHPAMDSERIYDDLQLRAYLRRKYRLAKNRVWQLFGRQIMR